MWLRGVNNEFLILKVHFGAIVWMNFTANETLHWKWILMCDLWLKLNPIMYLSSAISPLSVLSALLWRPPLLLSLALSSNLTLMLTHFVTPRWLSLLSLSLSLSIARRTRVPADAFLSRAGPRSSLSLSLALTLSNSLHLHSPLHTVLSTKLENKGRRGNRE